MNWGCVCECLCTRKCRGLANCVFINILLPAWCDGNFNAAWTLIDKFPFAGGFFAVIFCLILLALSLCFHSAVTNWLLVRVFLWSLAPPPFFLPFFCFLSWRISRQFTQCNAPLLQSRAREISHSWILGTSLTNANLLCLFGDVHLWQSVTFHQLTVSVSPLQEHVCICTPSALLYLPVVHFHSVAVRQELLCWCSPLPPPLPHPLPLLLWHFFESCLVPPWSINTDMAQWCRTPVRIYVRTWSWAILTFLRTVDWDSATPWTCDRPLLLWILAREKNNYQHNGINYVFIYHMQLLVFFLSHTVFFDAVFMSVMSVIKEKYHQPYRNTYNYSLSFTLVPFILPWSDVLSISGC